jgi:hypothetical protein
MGGCDGCSEWYQLHELKPQFEYRGDSLEDTGFLYCWRCISQPQPQLKPIILAPDPVPVVNPRPEQAQAGLGGISGQLPYPPLNGNQNGFAQVVGPQGSSITDPIRAELNPNQPFTSSAQLLASAATGWGLPQPNTLIDRSGTITTPGTGQQIMGANPGRTYLLIYQPHSGVLAVAQNSAPTLGISASSLLPPYIPTPPPEINTVSLGTGGAVLQNALLTPPATVWTGAVFVLGLIADAPFFAFEG